MFFMATFEQAVYMHIYADSLIVLVDKHTGMVKYEIIGRT